MRNLVWLFAAIFVALSVTGCSTYIEGVGKVGTKTEVYTAFHKVPVLEHPTTPEQWQAKADAECVDLIMKWRLPDGNAGWKHSRGRTGCVFSFVQNVCACEAPPPVSSVEGRFVTQCEFSTINHTGVCR